LHRFLLSPDLKIISDSKNIDTYLKSFNFFKVPFFIYFFTKN
jgi:hypothetical protein